MSYQIGCPCPCSYLCRQCQRPQSCTGCTWCSVPSAPEPVTIGATEGSLHSPDFAVTALIEEKFDPDVQTFYSHQCFDVQGHVGCRSTSRRIANCLHCWYQRSHVDADRSPNHYPTCNISDSIAQTYSDYFALHPVLGMIAHLVSEESFRFRTHLTHSQGQDGTVVKVYGPPLDLNTRPYFPQFSLWQENSRVTVPQPPYKSGTPRKDWTQKASLLFFMRKSLGVRLSDALYGKIGGIDHQGGSTLENCNAISIRIHVGSWVRAAIAITH